VIETDDREKGTGGAALTTANVVLAAVIVLLVTICSVIIGLARRRTPGRIAAMERPRMNIADGEGNTPLIAAVKSQQKQIVQMLLGTKGVNVNAQNAAGQTALHCASKVDPQNRPPIVALLARQKNVSIDIVDGKQKKPLQDAPQLAELFLRIHNS
jgi:hypothetical protein